MANPEARLDMDRLLDMVDGVLDVAEMLLRPPAAQEPLMRLVRPPDPEMERRLDAAIKRHKALQSAHKGGDKR